MTYPGAPGDPQLPTGAAGLPRDPIGPYDVSIHAVGSLIRNVNIVPSQSNTRNDKSVTHHEVTTWINELSVRAGVALWQYDRIPETHPARPGILTAISGAIANGVASYVYAAAHPEMVSPADGASYSQILWSRYTDGLEEINTTITGVLAHGTGGAAWSFPRPQRSDREPF